MSQQIKFAASAGGGGKPALSLRGTVITGLLLILFLIGGLGTWSALASLSGAIVASGVVTVDSNRKTVQHLEGGIVARLMVRDGAQVEQGQLLIKLDDTRAAANLSIIEGQLDAFEGRMARLKAERKGSDKVVYPAFLSARRHNASVSEILEGQTALFEARQESLQGQITLLQQRIAQFKEQIRGLHAQQRSKARQREILAQELEGLRTLYDKGYAPLTRILELERASEELKGERGRHIADIAQAEKGIGEAELEILQLKKTIREEVESEHLEVQAEVFNLNERRIAALDELNRVEIRAPRSGTVVGMDVHTVGGVISPGQPILDIVPKEDELIIEARVEPQDIDKIARDQAAIVRLSAFNLRTTPELTGLVTGASADRLIDEATGLPFYNVRVKIPATELAKLEGLILLPGMPAEVFIQTGERTALSYLIKPFSDSLERAFREE